MGEQANDETLHATHCAQKMRALLDQSRRWHIRNAEIVRKLEVIADKQEHWNQRKQLLLSKLTNLLGKCSPDDLAYINDRLSMDLTRDITADRLFAMGKAFR